MFTYDKKPQEKKEAAKSKDTTGRDSAPRSPALFFGRNIPNSVMLDLLGRQEQQTEQTEPNRTGLSDALKARFENMSGFSFDDVRVHYNSDKPAALGAEAYTKGNDVHISPGQEQHLEHELGHVVQQKAGVVKPENDKSICPSDNEHLENEADNFEVLSANSKSRKVPTIQFNGGGKRNQKKKGVFREQPDHKEATATAEIRKITIGTSGKANTNKSKKTSKGFSNSYRDNNPSNDAIEKGLTAHANNEIKSVANKTEILPKNQQADFKPIATQEMVNVVKNRTWGNCAEPHAVYEIINNLSTGEYLHKLTVNKAVSASPSGAHYHNASSDGRCANCAQWCSKEPHKLPTNPTSKKE